MRVIKLVVFVLIVAFSYFGCYAAQQPQWYWQLTAMWAFIVIIGGATWLYWDIGL